VEAAAVTVRDAAPRDWPAIWPFFRETPAARPAQAPSALTRRRRRRESLSPARAVPLGAHRGASPFPYFCGIQPPG